MNGEITLLRERESFAMWIIGSGNYCIEVLGGGLVKLIATRPIERAFRRATIF